jgi:hypothetical protein
LADQEQDHYSVLGLTKSSSPKEIKSAYRRLALKWHPDKNENSKESAQMFVQIGEAYEILSDAGKKREYDEGSQEQRFHHHHHQRQNMNEQRWREYHERRRRQAEEMWRREQERQAREQQRQVEFQRWKVKLSETHHPSASLMFYVMNGVLLLLAILHSGVFLSIFGVKVVEQQEKEQQEEPKKVKTAEEEEAEVDTFGVKEIKQRLKDLGADYADCIEKAELVARLKATLADVRGAAAAAAAAAKAEAEAAAGPFLCGQTVAIHGIVSRPELNGATATVVRRDANTGRFEVQLASPLSKLVVETTFQNVLTAVDKTFNVWQSGGGGNTGDNGPNMSLILRLGAIAWLLFVASRMLQLSSLAIAGVTAAVALEGVVAHVPSKKQALKETNLAAVPALADPRLPWRQRHFLAPALLVLCASCFVFVVSYPCGDYCRHPCGQFGSPGDTVKECYGCSPKGENECYPGAAGYGASGDDDEGGGAPAGGGSGVHEASLLLMGVSPVNVPIAALRPWIFLLAPYAMPACVGVSIAWLSSLMAVASTFGGRKSGLDSAGGQLRSTIGREAAELFGPTFRGFWCKIWSLFWSDWSSSSAQSLLQSVDGGEALCGVAVPFVGAALLQGYAWLFHG